MKGLLLEMTWLVIVLVFGTAPSTGFRLAGDPVMNMMPTRPRGLSLAALSLEGDVSTFGGSEQDIPASTRLQKARLRLAEAQGIIPAGSSERYQTPGGPPRTTKVRDLTFKVAEPEVQYDPDEAEARLWRQPLRWLRRNVDLFVPLTAFLLRVISDIATDQEEQHRRKRAQELLEIISKLGPAVIKAGQALSSRPDLLPTEYLEELQKLQDRLPPFPNEQAFQVVEAELGVPFDQVFELLEENPIAAASIGQVYKATLRSTGETVAVKVQRPRCEEIISVDLYVLRWYAGLINRILGMLQRDIDVIAVIDDFGELIYREIDYTAEAANAQRFVELYGGLPDIFVPRVYTELSTRKVLTLEWVDGARLVDQRQLEAYRADPTKLVDRLVQCSLRQMLENGFFHADPHAVSSRWALSCLCLAVSYSRPSALDLPRLRDSRSRKGRLTQPSLCGTGKPALHPRGPALLPGLWDDELCGVQSEVWHHRGGHTPGQPGLHLPRLALSAHGLHPRRRRHTADHCRPGGRPPRGFERLRGRAELQERDQQAR